MAGKLYRSHDALACGVCAGIADKLGLDPVIVRILMVIFCLVTLGAGVVVYIALIAAVPLEPEDALPVDVRPDEVLSESYGSLASSESAEAQKASAQKAGARGGKAQKRSARAEAASAAAGAQARRDLYAGVAHEPPTPPLAAQNVAAFVATQMAQGTPVGDYGVYANRAAAPAAASVEAAHAVAAAQAAAVAQTPVPLGGQAAVPAAEGACGSFADSAASSADPARFAVAADSAERAADGEPEDAPTGSASSSAAASPGAAASSGVAAADAAPGRWRSRLKLVVRSVVLWLCFAVVFVALLRLLGNLVYGASWWRFWPVFLTLSGIAVMVVPGKPGVRMAHAVSGWFLVVAGSVVLPMSLGLVRWASLASWLEALWPLLAAAFAFLAVGWARRSWPWALVAGVLFTLFCVMGLLAFAQPGAVDQIVLDIPFSRSFTFGFPF